MELINTSIPDLFIIKPRVYSDNRGWFMESWNKKDISANGLFYDFVQDNQSFSAEKGVLRGLHCQIGDGAQAKLVRCVRGSVLDVAVDLRFGSPTYKKWFSIELSADNKIQLLIPRGFAHGFLTLTNDVEFLYKTDNFYSRDNERGILWNDNEIGIEWGIESPLLSEKDKNAPRLFESGVYFEYQSLSYV